MKVYGGVDTQIHVLLGSAQLEVNTRLRASGHFTALPIG
jgi:hypothetical protein